MSGDSVKFQAIPFPMERIPIIDAGRIGSRRHLSHGFLEVDVTRPSEILHNHKDKTGETLSFTGYIVKCLGDAVAAMPYMHAYRNWRNQLILFEEVDIVTLIEATRGEVAIPHIIRRANHKTFLEINEEIRRVQNRPERSPQKGGLRAIGPYMPRFIRDLFYWWMRMSPFRIKRVSGTVTISSVGMFGKGSSGWGLGFIPWHTMMLLLGGISQKPAVVEGSIAIRDILCLTVSFDHDIVDGAPAARFIQRLKEMIESAACLQDLPLSRREDSANPG